MTALSLPRVRGRAAALAAALGVALASAAPSTAAAQRVTVGRSPVCGGAPCGTLRFRLVNPGAGALALNTLTLTTAGAAFVFAPVDAGNPAVGSVSGRDAVDVLFAPTTIGGGGTSLFADFAGDLGFPFALGARGRGFLDVETAPALAGGPATPRLAGVRFAFRADVAGGADPVVGTVAVVPEPATAALVAGGLAGLAAVARRRRGS